MGQKKKAPGTRSFELHEEEIISLAAQGYTVKEMMPKLGLNHHVLEKYIILIKDKWGAINTPNLIHLWHEKRKEVVKRG